MTIRMMSSNAACYFVDTLWIQAAVIWFLFSLFTISCELVLPCLWTLVHVNILYSVMLSCIVIAGRQFGVAGRLYWKHQTLVKQYRLITHWLAYPVFKTRLFRMTQQKLSALFTLTTLVIEIFLPLIIKGFFIIALSFLLHFYFEGWIVMMALGNVAVFMLLQRWPRMVTTAAANPVWAWYRDMPIDIYYLGAKKWLPILYQQWRDRCRITLLPNYFFHLLIGINLFLLWTAIANLTVASMNKMIIILFIIYTALIYLEIRKLPQRLQGFYRALTIAFRLKSFMYEEKEFVVQSLNFPIKELYFENIHAAKQLKIKNLRAYQHEKIALFSEDNALIDQWIDLMMKTEKGYAGDIYLDGVRMRDLSLSCLHHHILYVPFEGDILPLSLRDNLLMGDLAHEADLLWMSEKYDFMNQIQAWGSLETKMTPHDPRVSQQLKRKICLMRYALQPASIKIYDERNDNTSTEDYHDVLRLILQSQANMVIVLVSRPEGLELFDRYWTLKSGTMIEINQSEASDALIKQGSNMKDVGDEVV